MPPLERYRPEGSRRSPLGWWAEVPVVEGPGWVVAGYLARSGDEIVLSEVRVLPAPVTEGGDAGEWSRSGIGPETIPAGGITAGLLRRLSMVDLVSVASTHLTEIAQTAPPGHWATVLDAEPARPGRTGRPDEYWALWAQRYCAAADRNPTAAIAEFARAHGLKRDAARDRVYTAASKGFLTKPGRGRARRFLTKKATETLAKMETTTP